MRKLLAPRSAIAVEGAAACVTPRVPPRVSAVVVAAGCVAPSPSGVPYWLV